MKLSRRSVLGMVLAAPVVPRMAYASSAQPLAINLAPIRDWSTQQPFIDVFKTARRWIGHLPGQWGGHDFTALEAADLLDANGWPLTVPRDLGSIGTMILTDLPKEALTLAGRYCLRFDGDGIVEVGGRAQNTRYGRNEINFDFAPGPGSVDIRIQRSDPLGKGSYVRNISVVRADTVKKYQAGARFRPEWLEVLRGFCTLRFMDWMNTNDSSLHSWDSRAHPDDFSYTRRGAPLEVMLELANELGADAWLCVPHLMDDASVRTMAMATLAALSSRTRAHVEFSNEVWNFQFTQAKWAAAQAGERWG